MLALVIARHKADCAPKARFTYELSVRDWEEGEKRNTQREERAWRWWGDCDREKRGHGGGGGIVTERREGMEVVGDCDNSSNRDHETLL